jgi:hypothetical protein
VWSKCWQEENALAYFEKILLNWCRQTGKTRNLVKNKSNPSFHFIFKKWPKEKINGQKRKKIASGKNISSQKEKIGKNGL